MRILSKSKLMAWRQCPKRLWLEVYHPGLREDSTTSEAAFSVGHQVGDIARQLYDRKGNGVLIDPQVEGFDAAFARTRALLQSAQPVFEAGFRAEGALAFADVMLPKKRGGNLAWRMVEVKSSTSVKDYHHDDAAIQAFVAQSAGAVLQSIALAHIDSDWVYPGNGDYAGLLQEHELTEEAFARADEVRGWITEAQQVLAQPAMPDIACGRQCDQPYACGFHDWCQSQQPQPDQPIDWLPGKLGGELQAQIEACGWTELRDVPDELLTQKQQRVKSVTVSGMTYFDQAGAVDVLSPYKLPAYFLDFETIQFAVPIWKGTRPYQQIPFQFSLHRLSRTGKLEQQAFLDLSGDDPSRAFAETLIDMCGERGPIFVYSAAFETSRIRDLAERFPRLRKSLLVLNDRVVDLLPVAREHYYHPSQHGSWSIKKVLPAVCPDLDYQQLDGVQDGGMAMEAFLEAIAPQTSETRKAEIEQQLLAYCALDTYAMVRLWAYFTGSTLDIEHG